MIINRHDCINLLLKYDNEPECEQLLSNIINNNVDINSDVLRYLLAKGEYIPVIEHYKLLNNKAHKVIKEILTCEGREVAIYIKIATSLITQGTITLEHKFKDDVKGANRFIAYTRLPELSEALYFYFKEGNFDYLVFEINNIRKDIELILNI